MRKTILVVLPLLAAVLWPGAGVQAQTAPEAEASEGEDAGQNESGEQASFQELTRRGARAFEQQRYDEAVELFEKAYAIRPIPNLLYNIGRVYEKQGTFEKAISYYEKFINEPDVDIKARRDALQRLKTLREVVAMRQEGEEVDQEQVAKEQGEHKLAEPAVPDEDKKSDKAQPKVEENYVPAYLFTTIGAASLIGSGVFAALAAGAHGDFDSATTLTQSREAAESGQTYTTVADSLLAAGVVAGGVGLYFWAAPPTEEHAAPSPSASLTPAVGPQGASLTLTVDF